MNQARFTTAEQIRQEIEDYCDAKEESEQSRELSSGYVGALDRRKHDNDRAGVIKHHLKEKGKGKGKSKDKDDKGGKGKPKGKWKGKDHKGLGKDPQRSEARRFGGKVQLLLENRP